MNDLINQPSKFPTRKIAAVVISGMVVGGIQSLLLYIMPEASFAPMLESLDVWLQGVVMAGAGYFVRERKSAP